MGFSVALRCYLPVESSLHFSKFSPRFNLKQNRVAFLTTSNIESPSLQIVKSISNNMNSSINENGATEPARVLLERLFAQTLKLEEQMSRDSRLPEDVQPVVNLEILESDLLALLKALNKKEDELQDAGRNVFMEHSRLNQAKEELEKRENEITAAFSKHEKLEGELKQANLNLASQAGEIEYLKLQLKEREQDIASACSALSLKEDEMDKMKADLLKKSEEAARIDSELKYKAQLLNQASEVVKRQETELQGLQMLIREKEEELEVSMHLRKFEEEKLKIVGANLEDRTREWLLMREELNKLAKEASKQVGDTNEALEDFGRVYKLLADVRSELISSQKSLAFSKKQMEEQEQLLKRQLAELEEQRKSVMSYLTSLKNAKIEVESERVKLRTAEARSKELERDLSMEKVLVEELQKELEKEKSSLEQHLLQAKESDLVEAKLDIQTLKSEQASLQLVLEEKDLQLFDARKNLDEVNQEVAELRMLMSGKEEQLVQATTMIKEKEEHVQVMQDELNDTRVKVFEAESVVERIVELTSELVISIKDQNELRQSDNMTLEFIQQPLDEPSDDFRLQKKQYETELRFSRESLRVKEMEVLAAQRALTIKDEELKTERIGETCVGDLAIEKLKLEAAQLEVEAATSALQKLAEMSRELLNKTSLSIEADADFLMQNGSGPGLVLLENNECFKEVKTEVVRLSSLTDQLLQDAGITVGAD
ncbi:hypothetical protein OIU77_031425 [Salix suchowensis]|uniref:Uncharacterized protein n=1 Tax=Salix suchowensis TaxID=1278906 RepID=A0ABQ9BHT4_9ROSI|nr:hypothetical protein OIU77_031425 [Salix suchowensis]